MFKTQKSVDMISSGKNGLTLEQMQVPLEQDQEK